MVVRHNFPTAVLWRDPALLFLLLLHLASFMSLSDYQVKPSLTQLPQKDGEVVEIGSGDIMSGVFSWESVGFCQPAAEGSWFPQRRRSSGKLREASWRPAEEASRFHRHYSPMSILNNIMSTWKTVWMWHSPQDLVLLEAQPSYKYIWALWAIKHHHQLISRQGFMAIKKLRGTVERNHWWRVLRLLIYCLDEINLCTHACCMAVIIIQVITMILISF